MNHKIRVTVWGEYVHEKKHPDTIGKLYPRGLRETPDFEVRAATL